MASHSAIPSVARTHSVAGFAALMIAVAALIASCSPSPSTSDDDRYAPWYATPEQVDVLLTSGDLQPEITAWGEETGFAADELGSPIEIHAFTPAFVAGDGAAQPPTESTGTWLVPVFGSSNAGEDGAVARISGDPEAPGTRAVLVEVSWDPGLTHDLASLPAETTLVEYQPKGAIFTLDADHLTAVRYRWGPAEWTLEDWAAELVRAPGGGADP